MKFIAQVIINAITFFLVDLILPGIHVNGIIAYIALGFAFALVNMFIKPILNLISLPINIITLGLFSFVVNAIVLRISFGFVSDASIGGFWVSIFGAILFSIVNKFVEDIFKKK